jgi:4,5-DOPA dioxygenase extradiol
MTADNRIQSLYISHGGGPMPLLGDPGHAEMVKVLKKITQEIPKPSTILLISAHWEEAVPTITSGEAPPLIYDYYGFPPESYRIQYPAKGQPELAQAVYRALDAGGLSPRLDEKRGFDHGMFVPLKLMYPEADIPVVQLSLNRNLSPEQHLAIGQALQTLEWDKLLVLGSGFSFHNMRAFFAPDTPELQDRNLEFERWLNTSCMDTSLAETERRERFSHWSEAPYARYCHPREEHLLPIHVCYGAAGRPADRYWSASILGKKSGMYYWG